VMTYPTDATPVRLILSAGTLVTSCWKSPNNSAVKGLWGLFQNQSAEGQVRAFDAGTGKTLWTVPHPAQYMLARGSRVFLLFAAGTLDSDESLVALDRESGRQLWKTSQTDLESRGGVEPVCVDDHVLIAANMAGKRMIAVSVADGQKKWEVADYASAIAVGDDFWIGKRRCDPATGDVRGEIPAALFSKNGGAPCTPQSVVASKIILDSRSGRFVDCVTSNSYNFRGARGGCIQGATTANGMFYSGQNRCRCTRNQVPGFLGFGAVGGDPTAADVAKPRPVERGPAFGAVRGEPASPRDWAFYRHDAQRSGATDVPLKASTNVLWEVSLCVADTDPWAPEARDAFYEKLTPPVSAAGLTVVARINAGEQVAVSTDSGQPRWRFAAGG
jgi:hypothetical protein